MRRDMELIRKILLLIEEKHIDVGLDDSQIMIDGYDMKTIAYHCSILHDAGLINDYGGFYADNGLQQFGVGSLTWEGHEFLDKIKNDTVWKRTKKIISERGIPFVMEAVKEIATKITAELIKSAVAGH